MFLHKPLGFGLIIALAALAVALAFFGSPAALTAFGLTLLAVTVLAIVALTRTSSTSSRASSISYYMNATTNSPDSRRRRSSHPATGSADSVPVTNADVDCATPRSMNDADYDAGGGKAATLTWATICMAVLGLGRATPVTGASS